MNTDDGSYSFHIASATSFREWTMAREEREKSSRMKNKKEKVSINNENNNSFSPMPAYLSSEQEKGQVDGSSGLSMTDFINILCGSLHPPREDVTKESIFVPSSAKTMASLSTSSPESATSLSRLSASSLSRLDPVFTNSNADDGSNNKRVLDCTPQCLNEATICSDELSYAETLSTNSSTSLVEINFNSNSKDHHTSSHRPTAPTPDHPRQNLLICQDDNYYDRATMPSLISDYDFVNGHLQQPSREDEDHLEVSQPFCSSFSDSLTSNRYQYNHYDRIEREQSQTPPPSLLCNYFRPIERYT